MKQTTIPTLIAVTVVIIIAVAIAPTPVLAQTPDTARSPFGTGASPEAERTAIEIAVSQIWNLTGTSPSITFSEDGTLSITQFANNQFITVNVYHNLTPENGYVYDNSQIFAPNGTKVFP